MKKIVSFLLVGILSCFVIFESGFAVEKPLSAKASIRDFDSIPQSPVSDFSYELSNDGNGVKITAYEGGAICNIPAEIEGMPVTEISTTTFYSNTKLTVVVMPDTIKNIIGDDLFYRCRSLTSVKLSSSLTVIPRAMFRYCESLKSIEIPSSVTIIEGGAFADSGLTSIYIPDTVTQFLNDAMDTIGIFQSCEELTEVHLSNSVKVLSQNIFNGCTKLKSISLPNGITEISDSAFMLCSSLTSVSIPHSVKKIGKNAFRGCRSLTALVIPDSVTTIDENAFFGAGLVVLEIPDSVTKLSCTFSNCYSLKKLRIPNSITELKHEMFFENYQFNAKSLESINLPASLKKMDSFVFYEFENLKELIIPDSLTKIEFETNPNFGEMQFSKTALPLLTQKRLKDMGYKGSFSN